MTIYEHRATITAVSGSAATVTLKCPGGILSYVLVRALTSFATTVFRAQLIDENGINRINWGWHRGELNDQLIHFPIVGPYSLQVVNIVPTDTFSVVLAVEEPH